MHPHQHSCDPAQVMLRKDAAAASALMLYRKKPEQIERAPPAFLAAPSAEASNEVRPPPVLLRPQFRHASSIKQFVNWAFRLPQGMLGKCVSVPGMLGMRAVPHRRWMTGWRSTGQNSLRCLA